VLPSLDNDAFEEDAERYLEKADGNSVEVFGDNGPLEHVRQVRRF